MGLQRKSSNVWSWSGPRVYSAALWLMRYALWKLSLLMFKIISRIGILGNIARYMKEQWKGWRVSESQLENKVRDVVHWAPLLHKLLRLFFLQPHMPMALVSNEEPSFAISVQVSAWLQLSPSWRVKFAFALPQKLDGMHSMTPIDSIPVRSIFSNWQYDVLLARLP